MKHKLAIELTAAIKAGDMARIRAVAKPIVDLLERAKARQSAGGKAAAGNSGRKAVPFDLERARELQQAGKTLAEIAADQGVGVATVSRKMGPRRQS